MLEQAMARPGGSTRESGRRTIVQLILITYLLLIFEGVLRKWLFPDFSRLLFFIRDPVVALIYILAARHGFWGEATAHLRIGVAFAVLSVAVVIAQSFGNPGQAGEVLLLAVYGWRNYFFYIPLAFVIGAAFNADDIARLVRWTLILSLPMAVLTAAQYYAPINSPLNVGSADDASLQFQGLGADELHTRPMGTFTSALGTKLFVASTTAMLLATWLGGISMGGGWMLRIAATLAVLVCLSVSGSRGLVLHAGLLVVVAASLAFISRESRVTRRALWVPITLIAAGSLLAPLLLGDALQTFITRWNSAYAVESANFSWGVFGRALYGFVDFLHLFDDTPLAGYGLGLAGNAGTTLGATVGGKVPLSVAENDWARHIVDIGPVLGALFIAYRISITAWIGTRAFAAARSGGSPVAWLFFAFAGIDLLYGQITAHGSVNGYIWIFAGLCLAASRREAASAVAPVTAVAVSDAFPNLMR